MNFNLLPFLAGLLKGRRTPRGGLSGHSAGGYQSAPLGGYLTDKFGQNRAPSPAALLRELVGVTWACADLKASAVAQQPLRLYLKSRTQKPKGKYFQAYRRTHGYDCTIKVTDPRHLKYLAKKAKATGMVGIGGDAQAEIEEVTDHPLLSILKAPEFTEDDFGLNRADHQWATQMFRESLGRAYWYIERGPYGMPAKFWLLQTQFVKELPSKDGTAFIESFQYGDGPNKQFFDPSDIVKFHNPDMAHLRRNGYSPLMAALEKSNIIRKSDANIDAMLENMAVPSMILTPEASEGGGFIGWDQASRLRSAVRKLLAEAGSGGVLVLPDALKATFAQWKPAEIVDDKRYLQAKTDLAGCYRVPIAMLEINGANRAVSESAEYVFAKYGVLPQLATYEETLNHRVVPLFDDTGDMFLAFDNPVEEDKAFELEKTKSGFDGGNVTVGEFRVATGLPLFGDERDDCRYIDGTKVLIGPKGELPEPPAPVVSGPGGAKPKKPKQGKAMRAAIAEMAAAVKIMAEHSTKGSDNGNHGTAHEITGKHGCQRAPGIPASDAASPDDSAGGNRRGAGGAGQEVKSRLADAGYTDAEIAASLAPAHTACGEM